MGLDLTIGIIRTWNYEMPKWWLIHNRISFGRNYVLFSYIEDVGRCDHIKPILDMKDIPNNVCVEQYEDEGLKKNKKDPYGSEMKWCYAKEFMKIDLNNDKIRDYNKSIIRFIQSMPEHNIIIVRWS